MPIYEGVAGLDITTRKTPVLHSTIMPHPSDGEPAWRSFRGKGFRGQANRGGHVCGASRRAGWRCLGDGRFLCTGCLGNARRRCRVGWGRGIVGPGCRRRWCLQARPGCRLMVVRCCGMRTARSLSFQNNQQRLYVHHPVAAVR